MQVYICKAVQTASFYTHYFFESSSGVEYLATLGCGLEEKMHLAQ